MQDPRNRARRTFAPAPVQTTEEIRRQAGDAGRSFVDFVARERDPRRMRLEEDGRDSIRAVPDRPVDRALAMLPESVERAARSAGRAFDRGPIGTALRLVRESDPSELAADAAGGPLIRGARVVSAARALPMDEASRVARARELGFDTDRRLYHGTQADISAFEARRPGSQYQMNIPGVHLTESKDFAQKYASGEYSPRRAVGKGNVVEAHIRRGKTLNAFDPVIEGSSEAAFMEDLLKGTGQKPFWQSSTLDGSGPKMAPPLQAYIDRFPKKAEKLMDKYGINTVEYMADSTTPFVGSYIMKDSAPSVLVRNPSDIRRTDAAFDPAKRDSADLLASLALPAMFTGGAVANQRRKREDQ